MGHTKCSAAISITAQMSTMRSVSSPHSGHLKLALPPAPVELHEQCVAIGEIGSFIAVGDQAVGLLALADLLRPTWNG
jgi:hypothetical protein